MSTTDPIVIHLQAKDDGVNEVFDSAERAIKKQKKAVDDTMRRMKEYHRTLGMTKQELEIYRLKQLKASDATIRAAERMAALTKAKEKDIQTNKRMNGSLRMIRGGFGQVGHQLQDITIQAQMGTDAFIILGQQGSQIASIFGPGGAMIGALLAVGAAFASYISSSNKASDSLKELKESGDEVASMFRDDLFGATSDVTEEFLALAKASKTLAITDALINQASATQALADAQSMVNKEFTFVKQVYSKAIDQSRLVALTTEEIAEKYGVATQKADEFKTVSLGLISDLNANRDTFLNFINTEQLEGRATPALLELRKKVDDLGKEGLRAATQLQSIENVLSRLREEGPLTALEDPATEKSLQKARDTLQSINTKFDTGAKKIRNTYVAAMRQATEAHNTLGSTAEERMATEEQLMSQMSNAILAHEQKRADAVRKRQEDEQKDQQKRLNNIDRVRIAETDAIAAINAEQESKRQIVLKNVNDTAEVQAAAALKLAAIESERQRKLADFHRERVMLEEDEAEKKFQIQQKGKRKIEDMMNDGTNKFVEDLQRRAHALESALAQNFITESEHAEYRKQLQTEYTNHLLNENLKIIGGLKNVEEGFVNASHAFITGAQNGTEAIQQFGRAIVDELIKSLVQMGVEHVKQMVIKKQIEAKGLSGSVAMNAGAMTAIAAASAPAAALVSLATAGGNSAPAVAGMGTAFATSRAMSLASFDGGGFTGMGARSGGVDGRGGFPAILHPNETVVDHTRGQGQGITIINNIDASGNQDVDEKIAIAVTQSSRQTVEQVHNMMRRGRM